MNEISASRSERSPMRSRRSFFNTTTISMHECGWLCVNGQFVSVYQQNTLFSRSDNFSQFSDSIKLNWIHCSHQSSKRDLCWKNVNLWLLLGLKIYSSWIINRLRRRCEIWVGNINRQLIGRRMLVAQPIKTPGQNKHMRDTSERCKRSHRIAWLRKFTWRHLMMK